MGTLYIVSSPIGNLEDISIRAIKTLFSVDIILCEDTRRTGLLIHELEKRIDNNNATALLLSITPKTDRSNDKKERKRTLVRYDDHTESKQAPWLVEQLSQGKDVALVSDAGTPLISDPGYKLVNEALKRGISVTSIPGPTAAVAALTVSGLPTDKFIFLGYPPEKKSHRIKLFTNLLQIHRCIDSTYILYCAPHKLQQTLVDMKGVLGDIEIVLARELTKVHEEVWRGTLSEAIKHFSDPKGEFVLLFR